MCLDVESEKNYNQNKTRMLGADDKIGCLLTDSALRNVPSSSTLLSQSENVVGLIS